MALLFVCFFKSGHIHHDIISFFMHLSFVSFILGGTVVYRLSQQQVPASDPPQSKRMHVRSVGSSKLAVGVNGCLSLCVSSTTGDLSKACPACAL